MIEHLVLFKVKPGTPATETERMINALRSLKTKVPGIRELTCGANTSERSQGYTHGLFVRFATQNDLASYITHAEHQRAVAECIRPISESIIVVDYES